MTKRARAVSIVSIIIIIVIAISITKTHCLDMSQYSIGGAIFISEWLVIAVMMGAHGVRWNIQ